MLDLKDEVCIGDNSIAIYDSSGQIIAEAKEIVSSHNLLHVKESFRKQGYASKILNILEEQIGEKEYERVAKASSLLFYINRGFVPYRKSNANMENRVEMESFFHDEKIDTEKMTKEEKDKLLIVLKNTLNNKKEEVSLPFPVLLKRDKNESDIYKMFLKRNLKKIT